MATAGPAPLFHGKAIVVNYNPNVRNPRIVHAAVHGLVRRLQEAGAGEDELLIRIHELVAEYDGLTARLVSRTPEAIEFNVARR